jgi:DNA primase
MKVNIPALLAKLGIEANDYGGELWAPCPHPNHKETRPSWSIANRPLEDSHGTFFCFGCHFTGGPTKLVSTLIGISEPSAYRWIRDNGLELKGTIPLEVHVEIKRNVSSTLKIPSRFRTGALRDWVTPVRRYIEQRGITPRQVERWSLGYVIDGAMGFRILFPCIDHSGKWLSWHGRTFVDADKRYKNAGKDDGFDPGALFGLQHWPKDPNSRDEVVVTEGAIDALACEREGATHIAAIGGSEPHQRQLLKFTGWKRILVATDGDHAGDKLFETLRASIGARSRVVRVPMPRVESGEKWDAGNLALKKPGELERLLCHARESAR